MSSTWKDERIKPWNPVKVSKGFDANMFQGSNTCIHTMNDEAGAWWKARFGASYVVTKVKILNRGDCCGKRLNDAKVFIGENLCGTIGTPEWIIRLNSFVFPCRAHTCCIRMERKNCR